MCKSSSHYIIFIKIYCYTRSILLLVIVNHVLCLNYKFSIYTSIQVNKTQGNVLSTASVICWGFGNIFLDDKWGYYLISAKWVKKFSSISFLQQITAAPLKEKKVIPTCIGSTKTVNQAFECIRFLTRRAHIVFYEKKKKKQLSARKKKT